MNYITSYCRITPGHCSVNGKPVLEISDPAPDALFVELYRQQDMQYPKFHKMDRLSKLGFSASQLVAGNSPHLAAYADDDVALLFANRHSSGETDQRFEHSYLHEGVPGPALFVYTLPNIVLGELAIKHKWYGENLFAVRPAFDAAFFARFGNMLLEQAGKACLCGWTDVGDTADALVFLAEKEPRGLAVELTEEHILQLYSKIT